MNKKSMGKKQFTVQQPKLTLIMGWFITIIMSAGLIFEIIDDEHTEWWFYGLFIGFILFGFYAVLHYHYWKVEVYSKALRYIPLFKKPYDIPIPTITKVIMCRKNSKHEKIVLYAGEKKLLSVSTFCDGYSFLINKLINDRIPFS